MTASTRIDSWYADTASPAPLRPELAGDAVCDVCVVGGGYTGLTAALELAERGLSVVVLEAERVGWGASGRNGGQIITGYNLPMEAIERLVGHDDARALWDLNREATAQLVDRVARHRIGCDLTWGYVHAAIKPRHLAAARKNFAEMSDRYGYRHAILLDRDGVRGHIGSGLYIGGLLDSGSGHLHPLNYAIGLAAAAEEAGCRLFEKTRVLTVDTGPSPVVTTAQGRVRARFVVFACNAYIDGLARRLDGWIMPVATCILATEPLGAERAERLLPTNAAVADMNAVLNYYRRSPDHRLLFGGGASYSGTDHPALRTDLRAKMLRVFPDLREVAVDTLWSGRVAITMNRLPQLGRLSPTAFFAHGYSGHGVALAGLAGRLIAEAMAGTAGRFDVFARIPHRRFPGGRALRMPGLAMAMLWFRLRDML